MKKAQALIIDDEADIRELLEITLNRMDIETETAENIHQAHTLLKESGSPYFCESSFWASKPKFAAKA
jgi:DNA-binding NtrC family response regulator